MHGDFKESLVASLQAYTPSMVTVPGARHAAVLIPIFEAPEPTIIFTVRSDSLSSHKGQISFPGGSIDDSDDSPAEAALRETHEEIGLDPSLVDVVGELNSFPTYVSGYVVTPFVGWLEEEPVLEPNPAEVAEILEVPLAQLTEEIRRDAGFSHSDRTYPTEAWIWNDHVIWGVTAYIIRGFLELMADAGLVERPGPWSWPLMPRP